MIAAAAPLASWSACARCAHRGAGDCCAHPIAVIGHGAPPPCDAMRSAEHLCGRDGRWHLYAAPRAAAGPAPPLAA